MQITSLKAREILDSKGVPTIETKITLSDGSTAVSGVPSGASTGATEVLELRDGDKSRYFGKGVLKAISNVNNNIASTVIGKEFTTQRELDDFLIELDGTDLKTNLGGNSILAVSMAFCRATAISKNIPLYEYFAQIYWGEGFDRSLLEMPNPMILIMEGGLHGNWSTDFQEYMIAFRGDRFKSYRDKLQASAEIFKEVHEILAEREISTGVGYEGAYSPNQMKSNKEAFEIMMLGAERAGYKPGEEIVMALDIASSEFYNAEDNTYTLKKEGVTLSREAWMQLQEEWFKDYPIWSIEDGLDQSDWEGWKLYMEKFGDKHQVVGDDFLTTNVKRISKAIEGNSVNSVLIKLNQIGSVTETLDAIRMTRENGWTAVISHRSGETNDDMIADLVVGTAADQCKCGGPDRGERLAKYNRLLAIEEELKLNN